MILVSQVKRGFFGSFMLWQYLFTLGSDLPFSVPSPEAKAALSSGPC